MDASIHPLTRSPQPLSEFYVHAVLQAARAFVLGRALKESKSFGLNRAIFYEAIKKGYIGRGIRGSSTGHKSGAPKKQNFGVLRAIGGEKAYTVSAPDGELRFMIGGKIQTPEAFDRQVVRRFPNWELVWNQALDIIKDAPKYVVHSASKFHKDIYKHWRDEMAQKWPQAQPVNFSHRRKHAAG